MGWTAGADLRWIDGDDLIAGTNRVVPGHEAVADAEAQPVRQLVIQGKANFRDRVKRGALERPLFPGPTSSP